jgi:hypothetical protein
MICPLSYAPAELDDPPTDSATFSVNGQSTDRADNPHRSQGNALSP